MAQDLILKQSAFKGLRNDIGEKFLSSEYFKDVLNFNQDDLIGANKNLCPARVNSTEFNAGESIDAYISYNYLDSNNVTQTELIVLSGGSLYHRSTSDILLDNNFTVGKASYAIYQDKLFIANGKDYIRVYNGSTGKVYDMGAPEAIETVTAGNPTGAYYYAITFVTAGGEEVTGAVSNTVSVIGKQISLNIPIGYDGTTSRKIYRTEAGGSTLKLVATIADNTSLTYTDNVADGSLGATIPAINNEAIKPYFITTQYSRIIACVCDNYPTQLFYTGQLNEVIDPAAFLDISNLGNDNTPLKGMALDYNLIVLASEKQVYTVNLSGETPDLNITRVNIGCLNGYTMAALPSNGSFQGGIMFVSSDFSVRLINGNFAQPLTTQIDNIRTDNWAQEIRTSLLADLSGASNLYSIYHNFKYYLVIDDIYYTFDIRTLGWMRHKCSTENYTSTINILAVIDNELYNGQAGSSYIEKMEQSPTYLTEDLAGYIKFPYWQISDEYKFIKSIILFFDSVDNLDCVVNVFIDEDLNPITVNLATEEDGVFDAEFFDSAYFYTGYRGQDYRVIYINKPAKGVKVELQANSNLCRFREMGIVYNNLSNKER